jgi:putative DNA primase/helicase
VSAALALRPETRVTRGVVGSLSAHALTDIGNAQRFVYRHGADVRFVAATQEWFVFDGRRWAVDETREIERRVQDTAMMINLEVPTALDADARQALRKWAQASEGHSRLRAMQA